MAEIPRARKGRKEPSAMAFMALFGWILFPVILLGLLLQAAVAPLQWVISHPEIVNTIAAGLLAFHLLLLILLLRLRARRKKTGVSKGLVTFLAVLWEAWAVFLCALFLLIRPLRYIPEDFNTPFDAEHICCGEWELVSCQGIPPGYTRTEEEISSYLGTRIAYGPDRFSSNGRVYALNPEEPFDESTIWREDSIHIPGSLVSTSFEALDLEDRKLRRVLLNFQENIGKSRPIGTLFYLLDRDALMVYHDCIFFRAERVESSNGSAPSIPDPAGYRIPDPENRPYFGTWTVTESLGPTDPELSEEAAGAELSYRAESVLFSFSGFGGGCGVDRYREQEITSEDFAALYETPLEELGIEPGTYLHVTAELVSDSFPDTGRRFLLLDGETMLLCGGDTFFRAELVPDSQPSIWVPDEPQKPS